MNEIWHSPKDVARVMGVDRATIYSWIAQWRIESILITPRMRRIPDRAVHALLQGYRENSTPEKR